MPQTYDRSLDSHPPGQLLEAHPTGEHHRSAVTVPGESANASVNPSTPSRRQRPTSAPLSRAHVAYPHASRASRTARFARANKRPRNGHQGRRRPTDSAGRKRGSPSATRDVDERIAAMLAAAVHAYGEVLPTPTTSKVLPQHRQRSRRPRERTKSLQVVHGRRHGGISDQQAERVTPRTPPPPPVSRPRPASKNQQRRTVAVWDAGDSSSVKQFRGAQGLADASHVDLAGTAAVMAAVTSQRRSRRANVPPEPPPRLPFNNNTTQSMRDEVGSGDERRPQRLAWDHCARKAAAAEAATNFNHQGRDNTRVLPPSTTPAVPPPRFAQLEARVQPRRWHGRPSHVEPARVVPERWLRTSGPPSNTSPVHDGATIRHVQAGPARAAPVPAPAMLPRTATAAVVPRAAPAVRVSRRGREAATLRRRQEAQRWLLVRARIAMRLAKARWRALVRFQRHCQAARRRRRAYEYELAREEARTFLRERASAAQSLALQRREAARAEAARKQALVLQQARARAEAISRRRAEAASFLLSIGALAVRVANDRAATTRAKAIARAEADALAEHKAALLARAEAAAEARKTALQAETAAQQAEVILLRQAAAKASAELASQQAAIKAAQEAARAAREAAAQAQAEAALQAEGRAREREEARRAVEAASRSAVEARSRIEDAHVAALRHAVTEAAEAKMLARQAADAVASAQAMAAAMASAQAQQLNDELRAHALTAAHPHRDVGSEPPEPLRRLTHSPVTDQAQATLHGTSWRAARRTDAAAFLKSVGKVAMSIASARVLPSPPQCIDPPSRMPVAQVRVRLCLSLVAIVPNAPSFCAQLSPTGDRDSVGNTSPSNDVGATGRLVGATPPAADAASQSSVGTERSAMHDFGGNHSDTNPLPSPPSLTGESVSGDLGAEACPATPPRDFLRVESGTDAGARSRADLSQEHVRPLTPATSPLLSDGGQACGTASPSVDGRQGGRTPVQPPTSPVLVGSEPACQGTRLGLHVSDSGLPLRPLRMPPPMASAEVNSSSQPASLKARAPNPPPSPLRSPAQAMHAAEAASVAGSPTPSDGVVGSLEGDGSSDIIQTISKASNLSSPSTSLIRAPTPAGANHPDSHQASAARAPVPESSGQASKGTPRPPNQLRVQPSALASITPTPGATCQAGRVPPTPDAVRKARRTSDAAMLRARTRQQVARESRAKAAAARKRAKRRAQRAPSGPTDAQADHPPSQQASLRRGLSAQRRSSTRKSRRRRRRVPIRQRGEADRPGLQISNMDTAPNASLGAWSLASDASHSPALGEHSLASVNSASTGAAAPGSYDSHGGDTHRLSPASSAGFGSDSPESTPEQSAARAMLDPGRRQPDSPWQSHVGDMEPPARSPEMPSGSAEQSLFVAQTCAASLARVVESARAVSDSVVALMDAAWGCGSRVGSVSAARSVSAPSRFRPVSRPAVLLRKSNFTATASQLQMLVQL